MRVPRRGFVLANIALAGFTLVAAARVAPLAAQRVQLEVTPPASADDWPSVTTGNLLADSKIQTLLTSGFPTEIRFRLELWRKGRFWFDDLRDKAEWGVLVQYDPTTRMYNVVRRMGTQVHENFGGAPSAAAADAQFGAPLRIALRPMSRGRYYYNLVVDERTLTESDLDALQQWLNGPSAPGKANPITAVRSGLGIILSRVLGGDKRHFEARSGEFTVR
ncbi:MAG TPA: hypothetical protein VN600_13495 [Gemmatimonadaceae bacterium]|nr:hypothetical protein [Gemmatimonadaceae bacterium]